MRNAPRTKRYDVFTRFARAHLSTPVERAVYLTLVGAGTGSWSAAEIAERDHLARQEVAGVLERFEAAGIAELVGRKGGAPRYRWRSDMNYVLEASGESFERVDPVCGMPVSADTPYVARDAEGRVRRFCSSICLAAFRAFPAAFAPAPIAARAAPTGAAGRATGRARGGVGEVPMAREVPRAEAASVALPRALAKGLPGLDRKEVRAVQCYVHAKEGTGRDAVAVCAVCGMGVCLDHATDREAPLAQRVSGWASETAMLILCPRCAEAQAMTA